ncbi:MAG TPA: polyprenyl diphosphate synthase [Phycisphaerales bacterium]|nr:polyprenyl diphosphate synthase [Phycisphaerales bacterium]
MSTLQGQPPAADGQSHAAMDAGSRAALARIHAHNPDATPRELLPDVPVAAIPRHVAIIMDGNGRWAQKQGLARLFGHQAGAESVRRVLTEAANLGIEVLTLYSFSLENWKRPKDEVEALMRLAVAYFLGEEAELVAKGVRVKILGRREGLPADVLASMDRVVAATAHCRRITLCLAMNYGARAEIVDAARSIARDVAAGRLKGGDVTEEEFARRLTTGGLPDPDLLIRTAGEMRVSNYLLWQISYAEIHVTPTLWPDFGAAHLHAAVRDFASRSRRFGGLDEVREPR